MSQKPLRVALGNDCLGFSIEKYAVVADRKNARKLMCDDDNRCTQVVPQLHIRSSMSWELTESNPAEGSSNIRISGSSAMALAKPAPFCMPAVDRGAAVL
jgi:hypothetical protein